MDQSTEERVAALLDEAEAAHGAFERDVLGGRYDEAWPEWYAAYLLEHGLNDLLGGGSALTVEDLRPWLETANEAFRRERPAQPWPRFYARRLVGLGSGSG